MRWLLAVLVVASMLVISVPVNQASPSASTPDLDQKTRAANDLFFRIAMQDDLKTINTIIAQGEWDWKVLGWTQEGLYTENKVGKKIPWLLDDSRGDFDPETGKHTGYIYNESNPREVTAFIRPGVNWVQGFDGLLERIPLGCDPDLPWDPKNPDPEACEVVTAHDLVFTVNLLKYSFSYPIGSDPHCDALDPFRCQEIGMKVADADHYAIEFDLPGDPYDILGQLMDFGPYHQATWTVHSDEKYTWQPDPTDIPQIGPFLFASDDDWKRDQSIKLTRNPYYFAQEQGLIDGPFIDGIEFLIYRNTDTAVLALQNGDIDYIAWTIPDGYIPGLLDHEDITVTQSSTMGYNYLGYNMRNPAFGYDQFSEEERVDIGKPLRQAIAHLTDKIAIACSFLMCDDGRFGPGDSVVSPANQEWYNSSVRQYAFDPEEAVRILDANGFIKGADGWYRAPDGGPIDGPGGDGQIEIISPPADYDPITAQSGLWIAENLKAYGINAIAKPLDWGSLVQKVHERNFEIFISGWTINDEEPDHLRDFFRTDPDDISGGYNAVGYRNASFDEVVDEMVSSLDRDRRIELNKQAQGIIAEDLPINVLSYKSVIEAYRHDRLVGWHVKDHGGVFNQWTIYELQSTGLVTDLKVTIVQPRDMVAGDVQQVSIKVTDGLGGPVTAGVATLQEVTSTVNGTTGYTSAPFAGYPDHYTIDFLAPQVDEKWPFRICAVAFDTLLDVPTKRACADLAVIPFDDPMANPVVTMAFESQILDVSPDPGRTFLDVKASDAHGFPLAGLAMKVTWTVDCDCILEHDVYIARSLVTDEQGEARLMVWVNDSLPGPDPQVLSVSISDTLERVNGIATVLLTSSKPQLRIALADEVSTEVKIGDHVPLRFQVEYSTTGLGVAGATVTLIAGEHTGSIQGTTDRTGGVTLIWEATEMGDHLTRWLASAVGAVDGQTEVIIEVGEEEPAKNPLSLLPPLMLIMVVFAAGSFLLLTTRFEVVWRRRKR